MGCVLDLLSCGLALFAAAPATDDGGLLLALLLALPLRVVTGLPTNLLLSLLLLPPPLH
jgi:hypothetical protein